MGMRGNEGCDGYKKRTCPSVCILSAYRRNILLLRENSFPEKIMVQGFYCRLRLMSGQDQGRGRKDGEIEYIRNNACQTCDDPENPEDCLPAFSIP
jgi:hypothetical protein